MSLKMKPNRRDWLIAARKATRMSVNEAANVLDISPKLLEMLEWERVMITQPQIALRIVYFYNKGVDEYNELVCEKCRTDKLPPKDAKITTTTTDDDDFDWNAWQD